MSDLEELLVCREILTDPIIKEFQGIVSGKDVNKSDLAGKLVAAAERLGLSGNILHSYIIYATSHRANSVSHTVESSGGKIGTSLYRAFCHDMEIIDRVLVLKPSIILNCELLDDYVPTNVNTSVAFNDLLQKLEKTSTIKERADVYINYYRTYGSGDMADYRAFRWNSEDDSLAGIEHFEAMNMDDLIGYEYQKEQLFNNTRAFIDNLPANNVLLVGARGTGKSSGVKAVVNSLFDKGLRLVQLTKEQLVDLPIIMEKLRAFKSKKFIIFMDDLSFEEFEVEYKYLKSAIEGGASAKPENVLIYATSNRRHLIKESYKDRGANDDDMHRNDTLNETISLSDRFGLVIYYMAPNQQEYLHIVDELLQKHGIKLEANELRIKAGQWEREHSGRSGRTAQQFVTYYLGQVYKAK